MPSETDVAPWWIGLDWMSLGNGDDDGSGGWCDGGGGCDDDDDDGGGWCDATKKLSYSKCGTGRSYCTILGGRR